MEPLNLNFSKLSGLLPAIVQDANSGRVLMLGFMNQEAWNRTQKDKLVTFFSRTKNRIWQKGEESGHYLRVIRMDCDCDNDTLLIQALPQGPVCHRGTLSCFDPIEYPSVSFISELQEIIESRKKDRPEGSYTTMLFEKGIKKIAQKVGEEAVELALEAMDKEDELFLNEAADLMYHLLVLLSARDKSIHDVAILLRNRHLNPDKQAKK
jgi:phosphoribosyl-AMP cyclohydrolase / phosphoribosyl-ATP pyrophosphohydrolase